MPLTVEHRGRAREMTYQSAVLCHALQRTMPWHAISSRLRHYNEETEGVYDTSIAVAASCWRLFASPVWSSLQSSRIASNGQSNLPTYTPACATQHNTTLPVAGMSASSPVVLVAARCTHSSQH